MEFEKRKEINEPGQEEKRKGEKNENKRVTETDIPVPLIHTSYSQPILKIYTTKYTHSTHAINTAREENRQTPPTCMKSKSKREGQEIKRNERLRILSHLGLIDVHSTLGMEDILRSITYGNPADGK